YLMLLEKVPESSEPVKPAEPHYSVMPEFAGASYAKRYEVLCQRLVSEKLYEATCLILSEPANGIKVHYEEPRPSSSLLQFATSLLSYVVPRIGHAPTQQRLP